MNIAMSRTMSGATFRGGPSDHVAVSEATENSKVAPLIVFDFLFTAHRAWDRSEIHFFCHLITIGHLNIQMC